MDPNAQTNNDFFNDKVFSTIDKTGMVIYETHSSIDNKYSTIPSHVREYIQNHAATSGKQAYI